MKIGIIRESSKPNDRRTPVTPSDIKKIKRYHRSIKFIVQPSDVRIFSNDEYLNAGAEINEDLSMCDFIFGVKEVLPECLIPGKNYFFFAHIGKGQAYHKHYTSQLLSKNISLTDYEYLVDENHKKIAAFGKWAGMVGLYYGLMAFGKKYKSFDLKSPLKFNNHLELLHALRTISFPKLKIALTGNGNAAQGTLQLLKELGIKKNEPDPFLKTKKGPVSTQLHSQHYVKRKNLNPYEKNHFYQHPEAYFSDFTKYLETCNLFIPCHYWNPSSPYFFTIDDLQSMVSFPSIIADVSCDLNGPIPTTIRATTHQDPFYDYNVSLKCE